MNSPFPTLSRNRLLARLGTGGMAEVYLVVSQAPGGFNKLQVLKVMRSDLADLDRPDFLQMFMDEARLAARLNHPNLVQSFEVGSEAGQPFIVMEFLEGQPLNRVQQRTRRTGRGFALELELFVLCQVLEGLDYAHRLTDYDDNPLHIVHRDVSPQNIFITYTGQIKLLDFGVAKTFDSTRTRAGVVKGKIAYMAPEQVSSRSIDHRADLFSVGVLLWEAIAGRRMHADLPVHESLHRLVHGELPNIRDVQPDVPAELLRILDRALAMDPNGRYPDADSFRRELLAYLESTVKVSARDVGEAVAQMFSRERAELTGVIKRGMTETNSDEALATESPKRRVTRKVQVVRAHDALAEVPRAQEATPAGLLHTPPPRPRRGYWLRALSVVAVVAASLALALAPNSSEALTLMASLAEPILETPRTTMPPPLPEAMPVVSVPDITPAVAPAPVRVQPVRARMPRRAARAPAAAAPRRRLDTVDPWAR